MSTHQHPQEVPGGPLSVEDKVLETGASVVQDFSPTKSLCAHLNAFHTYADEPGRYVEANHYCAHLTKGMISHDFLSYTNMHLQSFKTSVNASYTMAQAPTRGSSGSNT